MPYTIIYPGEHVLLSIEYETKMLSPLTRVKCNTVEQALKKFADHKKAMEESGKKIRHATIEEMKNGVSIRCVFEYPTPKQKVEQLDLFAQSSNEGG